MTANGCRLFFRSRIERSQGVRKLIISGVYERLQAVGKACGVDACRPHRLRDTFAVRLLTKGVPLEDVSRLLGHASVAVTEKYYAPWVASRKLRLERLLSEALVNAKGH